MPFTRVDEVMAVGRAGAVQTSVRVPGSKSLTNRYLLLAALAAGESSLQNPLHSDDTVYMRQALEAVGCRIEIGEDHWRIAAPKRWQQVSKPLFVGNAGTAMRFLTPALSAAGVRTEITGNERMLKRPIRDLVEGLVELGAGVGYGGEQGYPPLLLGDPMVSGEVSVKGDASSQYLSGLLMALPLLQKKASIKVTTPLVSRTYVEMTLDCMAQMGVTVEVAQDFRAFHIPAGQRYRAMDLTIEPDASTASYWFALPLMVGGRVAVLDVPQHSHQGDFGLLDIFSEMGASITPADSGVVVAREGALKGVDVNMNTRSDVAPTLAVVATMATGPTLIRDIGNMRIKECDRIACIQAAFDALGLRMESGEDWMKIYPGRPTREAVLNPEDDHRMAMVFALLGLAHGGVRIGEPDCVGKTYPNFYKELGAVLRPIT